MSDCESNFLHNCTKKESEKMERHRTYLGPIYWQWCEPITITPPHDSVPGFTNRSSKAICTYLAHSFICASAHVSVHRVLVLVQMCMAYKCTVCTTVLDSRKTVKWKYVYILINRNLIVSYTYINRWMTYIHRLYGLPSQGLPNGITFLPHSYILAWVSEWLKCFAQIYPQTVLGYRFSWESIGKIAAIVSSAAPKVKGDTIHINRSHSPNRTIVPLYLRLTFFKNCWFGYSFIFISIRRTKVKNKGILTCRTRSALNFSYNDSGSYVSYTRTHTNKNVCIFFIESDGRWKINLDIIIIIMQHNAESH